ncbi:tRNA (adenosine(37)-N6)-threonylcarbamoyltransferase complex transferase subunit TsaD [Parvibaculum sp.]|uniref:tRNA (adenosine(37)-N6)-threonylcarbamoyltransferase complex transferase subunit TsaD n=1 Tax=Parvibaculum sp. TaxID=2024848 RepID=UPI002B5B56DE|nr:tRNA (adenosine(37)-N6)-threonylcarbamoyltransferase complex transferase subunit TsaD [Parvibaculum sp.]HUD53170.1 tRNA (adenosine(37)-N6)-threonylcarbamoyltransferase complex transferase subunit TsaD [Parvibaculum sp.]
MTREGVLTVLGIETSCDETAAAVVRRHAGGADGLRGEILSNAVFSQIREHAPYGGVVPEIAARAHVEHLDGLIARALADAHLDFDDLDAIAATAGPGLVGGVIVGLMTAKGIALARGLPLVAVNHLEGHALTARLTDGTPFPYLLLLVSGGHSQLLVVEGVGRYRRLGTTIDDAVGEAFDKVAKLMGLGFPGGPAVERTAADGDPARFPLPRPLYGKPGCDFSFSGLKTAVRQLVEAQGELDDQLRADIAASFQATVADVLADRVRHAMEMAGLPEGARRLVVAGGVASNRTLRARLESVAAEKGFDFIVPPARLCTDNGAMIAWAGAERLALGLTDGLDVSPLARWPLDPTAQAARGAGVKA